MEFTENDNRDEGDFFGGYFNDYFQVNNQNLATEKKENQNDDKKKEIFENLEDIEMRSKTELNEENKKTKTKLKNNKKIENKPPIVFIQKKTLRKEDEEDKKIKKKNSDLNHKTKTEIDYQIKKKNNPYDLDKIYNDFTEDENYYNLYKDEEKNDDEFIETLDELDFKTNKNKHANTIQDNYDIPEELNMEITSNNK
jgi:hypothetical protein